MPNLITVFEKCKILVVCFPLSLLAGCGGNPVTAAAEDIGNSIGKAIDCGFLQCRESNTLSVDQIATFYTVSQSGSDVHVDAQMSKGNAAISTLLLSPGDTLSASIGSQTEPLADISSGMRMHYAVDIGDSQSQPTVMVNFSRSGLSYSSTVVVPAQFAILAPNAPINVTLASGSFNVQLGIPDPSILSAGVSGNCTRVDGSSFDASTGLAYNYVGKVSGGTSYQVRAMDLDNALNADGQFLSNPRNLSPVQACNLKLIWTQSRSGTISPAMSSHSTIVGQTSVVQQVYYNAQH
jgi:hypothetical protein